MTYKLPYELNAFDFWKLTMASIYKTFAGLANIIFTLSMIGVTYAFWNDVNSFFRLILLFGLSLFTVIQPISIYYKSKSVTLQIPVDAEVFISPENIEVKSTDKAESYNWKAVKAVVLRKDLCIIRISNNQGIYLKYSNMGDKKNEIINFISDSANIK